MTLASWAFTDTVIFSVRLLAFLRSIGICVISSSLFSRSRFLAIVVALCCLHLERSTRRLGNRRGGNGESGAYSFVLEIEEVLCCSCRRSAAWRSLTVSISGFLSTAFGLSPKLLDLNRGLLSTVAASSKGADFSRD